MRKQIKLPNLDFAIQVTETTNKFISDHKPFLSAAFFSVIIDDIRVRHGRKKDRKTSDQNAQKQQKAIRKQESEINVLKAEAEQAQATERKVDWLEQIIKEMSEGGTQSE